MRLSDLKLGKKQGIAFGVIVALLAGVNFWSIHSMRTIQAELAQVTDNWLPSALHIAAINSNTSDLRISQLQYVRAPDDSARTRLIEVMTNLVDSINLNLDAYKPLMTTDREGRLYERFDESWDEYQGIAFELVALSRTGERDDAERLLNTRAQRIFNEMSEALEELVVVNQAASLEAAKRAEETHHATRRVVLLIFIVTVLTSIIIAWVLSRWITVPVQQLSAASEEVARGDLGVRVDLKGRDEIGNLADAFNKMTESLRDARDKIEAQQARLRSTNEELEVKNRDLEEAMRQLRETQQQLVMREKMASLGNLVAGVAHEINNPVGAVGSAADTSERSLEIVKRLLAETSSLQDLLDNKRFRTALDVLQDNNSITVTATKRITEIVKSLKNFARLDESDFQEADLHEGLDSTLTLLHHEIKKRIEVVKDYGDDVPRVQCYPNQLNQVFMNLLSNSSQAIDETGVITVRTRREGAHVTIEISDTGRGIDDTHLPHVFDPGFTTKGVGVGTGLGLSISYNIIGKHKGTIDAESVPGRGTTMRIRLPISQSGSET
jgi:signal transduction histidine kinase